MRIIKITDGFVTNSSSYNGTIVMAIRKDKDLKDILPKLGIPSRQYYFFDEKKKSLLADDYVNDFIIEIDDLTEEYNIFEATVLLSEQGADYDLIPGGRPKDELRDFIEKIEYTRERIYLLDNDVIILYCDCEEG